MRYKITITRIEPNPMYEKQVQEYNEKNRYNTIPETFSLGGTYNPTATTEVRKLEAELTEEEYDKFRKYLISQWDIK